MGGKPQLVSGGTPLVNRPSYVDSWQWSEPHWRPALVKGSNGTAWLAVTGAAYGQGVWADTWARMLQQMGAVSALGFDNNSSAELYRPGAAPLTAFNWERSIPSAVALSYPPYPRPPPQERFPPRAAASGDGRRRSMDVEPRSDAEPEAADAVASAPLDWR